MSAATKNAARRNGKAWKKNPGVPASAASGNTQDGYTPDKAGQREAKRAAIAAAPRKERKDTPRKENR